MSLPSRHMAQVVCKSAFEIHSLRGVLFLWTCSGSLLSYYTTYGHVDSCEFDISIVFRLHCTLPGSRSEYQPASFILSEAGTVLFCGGQAWALPNHEKVTDHEATSNYTVHVGPDERLELSRELAGLDWVVSIVPK